MAKYSTGGGGSNAGETCELCGAADGDLRQASVAGATLQVCGDCAQHDERGRKSSGSDERDGESTGKRAARNTARMHDAASNDPSHWESGADYDDDQLPYLVAEYDERLTSARQDAGYQVEELAEELGIDESDLLAIEHGRAAQAGVGGSVVEQLEDHLDVDLVDAE